MNRKKLVIWGATGQSLVLDEILRSEFETIALFDNRIVERRTQEVAIFTGVDGFDKWKSCYPDDISNVHFIVAIGGSNGQDRILIHDFLLSNGLKPITAIHPTAFVAYNAVIAEGAQILAHATICVDVSLGKSVIVNTAATVDHECIISQGVHIGPGARLAGCIKVNSNTFVGAGSVVLPRIEIGSNSVIGAGSVVTRNIPDNVVAYGNPCRVVRSNNTI